MLENLLRNDHALPGVSGEPHTAANFAKAYSEAHGLLYRTSMIMEAYHCPQVTKPSQLKGRIHKAVQQDVETVAQFMAGFSEDAYGVPVDPASQQSAAESAVGTGNVYLWLADEAAVSMANVAHRSPRHGRINAVYTPASFRKKGYASAIVAELGVMLYADVKNPDSNKVYKGIGFVEAGKIAEIKFHK